MNSPEMKLLQKEVEALKTQLYADNERISKTYSRIRKFIINCS